jgi:hypothetical protein
MCKPSCCTSSRDSGGTGIAAIAVLLVVVFIAFKIGPVVAEIGRIILDVIRIAAITLASAIVLAAMIWLTVRIARLRSRHRTSPIQVHQVPTVIAGNSPPDIASANCLACGGDGHVLRASRNGSFQVRACPECQPARLAG